MMDELVEKIARAICRAHCGPRMQRDEPDRVECQVANGWDLWADEARACLSAIEAEGMVIVPREPTEEMLAAGVESADTHDPNDECVRPREAAAIWSAMLDAAPKQG